jgi:hypothetical protein
MTEEYYVAVVVIFDVILLLLLKFNNYKNFLHTAKILYALSVIY